jgi:mono/diheme cytochrome c family protein
MKPETTTSMKDQLVASAFRRKAMAVAAMAPPHPLLKLDAPTSSIGASRLEPLSAHTGLAVVILAASFAGAGDMSTQSAAQSPETAAAVGAAIHAKHCAACHDSPQTRAPDRATLKLTTRDDAILASLVSGTMSVVTKEVSAADKRAVAEYLI